MERVNVEKYWFSLGNGMTMEGVISQFQPLCSKILCVKDGTELYHFSSESEVPPCLKYESSNTSPLTGITEYHYRSTDDDSLYTFFLQQLHLWLRSGRTSSISQPTTTTQTQRNETGAEGVTSKPSAPEARNISKPAVQQGTQNAKTVPIPPVKGSNAPLLPRAQHIIGNVQQKPSIPTHQSYRVITVDASNQKKNQPQEQVPTQSAKVIEVLPRTVENIGFISMVHQIETPPPQAQVRHGTGEEFDDIVGSSLRIDHQYVPSITTRVTSMKK